MPRCALACCSGTGRECPQGEVLGSAQRLLQSACAVRLRASEAARRCRHAARDVGNIAPQQLRCFPNTGRIRRSAGSAQRRR
eukprot:5740245-Alexandrium_andersonii.AAC.1